MAEKTGTRIFNRESTDNYNEILRKVYVALKRSGYDPSGQIVGYLASEDPTYITSFDGARSAITKVERYALMKEIVEYYLKQFENQDK